MSWIAAVLLCLCASRLVSAVALQLGYEPLVAYCDTVERFAGGTRATAKPQQRHVSAVRHILSGATQI